VRARTQGLLSLSLCVRVRLYIRPRVRACARGRVGAWTREPWTREQVGAWVHGRMCMCVCVISSTCDPKLAQTWTRSLAPLVTVIATVQSHRRRR